MLENKSVPEDKKDHVDSDNVLLLSKSRIYLFLELKVAQPVRLDS